MTWDELAVKVEHLFHQKPITFQNFQSGVPFKIPPSIGTAAAWTVKVVPTLMEIDASLLAMIDSDKSLAQKRMCIGFGKRIWNICPITSEKWQWSEQLGSKLASKGMEHQCTQHWHCHSTLLTSHNYPEHRSPKPTSTYKPQRTTKKIACYTLTQHGVNSTTNIFHNTSHHKLWIHSQNNLLPNQQNHQNNPKPINKQTTKETHKYMFILYHKSKLLQ